MASVFVNTCAAGYVIAFSARGGREEFIIIIIIIVIMFVVQGHLIPIELSRLIIMK